MKGGLLEFLHIEVWHMRASGSLVEVMWLDCKRLPMYSLWTTHVVFGLAMYGLWTTHVVSGLPM